MMRKLRKFALAILTLLPLLTLAQEKKEPPKFGISFSGFVKTDIFYDTRQTVNAREGHFLLYPENIAPDLNGKDINDQSTFNMLSIQSRLKGTITGPDAFGAKTSGVLEADFFGNLGTGLEDANGFRLRHAFVKLNWQTTELLVGQYWHPMFIVESFAWTLSFNTGAPFQPFSRNPQIRISQSFGGIKLIGSIYTQRDFANNGPDGISSKYLRNSAIPAGHFQVQFSPDSTEHVFGVGVDYKTLLPELYTVDYATKLNKFESSETISSMAAIAFAKFKLTPVTVKIEGVYAQNAYDLAMLGGYAVSQINDSATGAKEFTNFNTGSVWLDLNTHGKNIQFGLFAGYTKNLGSTDEIKTTTTYARNNNIDDVYRISPRVNFISGKFEAGLEVEYTVATYGNANGDNKGRVTDGKDVANTRFLLAVVYKF